MNTSTGNDIFTQKRARFGLSGLLVVLLFLAVGGYGAYLYTTKNALQTKYDATQQSVQSVTDSINRIRQKENVSDQLAAAEILKSVEAKRVNWSEMMGEIQAFETQKLQFISYSTNKDRQLFVTGQAETHEDVATMIEEVRASDLAVGEFVESIVENRVPATRGRGTVLGAGVQFQLVFTHNPLQS